MLKVQARNIHCTCVQRPNALRFKTESGTPEEVPRSGIIQSVVYALICST